MHRDAPEALVVGQQVVDADCARALEVVVGGDDSLLALDAEQGLGQGVDEIGLDRVFYERESVPLDARQVIFEM